MGFFHNLVHKRKMGEVWVLSTKATKSNSLKLERKLRNKIYSWFCPFLPIYNFYFSMSPLNSSTIKFTLCLHDLTVLKSNWFTIIMTMKRYSRANKLKFEEFRKKGRKKKLCQHAWWSWQVTKTDWQMRGKISLGGLTTHCLIATMGSHFLAIH